MSETTTDTETKSPEAEAPAASPPRIRAKMRLNSIDNRYNQEVWNFSAVYTGSPEDNTFAAATPAASMCLTVNAPALQGKLKAGDEFYVDLTPAPAAE